MKQVLINQVKQYFDVRELVCKHVYDKFKDNSWMFLDEKLLETLLIIRTNIDRPITVNNWSFGGPYSQRGVRCNICQLVKDKTIKGQLYMSAHRQGLAVDFDVKGMTAQEVREWISNNIILFPHNIRLERGVNWVHLDVFDIGNKLTYFNG